MGLGFSLDPAVPMSEAVRRVASAEIDTAYAALASPPERHKGVHDSPQVPEKDCVLCLS